MRCSFSLLSVELGNSGVNVFAPLFLILWAACLEGFYEPRGQPLTIRSLNTMRSYVLRIANEIEPDQPEFDLA
jgi:hypothetical protein